MHVSAVTSNHCCLNGQIKKKKKVTTEEKIELKLNTTLFHFSTDENVVKFRCFKFPLKKDKFQNYWKRWWITGFETLKTARTVNYNSNTPISKHKNTFAVLSWGQRFFPRFQRRTGPPHRAAVGDTKSSKDEWRGRRTVRAQTERLQSADRTLVTHSPQSRW